LQYAESPAYAILTGHEISITWKSIYFISEVLELYEILKNMVTYNHNPRDLRQYAYGAYFTLAACLWLYTSFLKDNKGIDGS
jgi:hypothetical protein